jgi:alkylation response protein AidB-like acyl-CoA dehydrogenase
MLLLTQTKDNLTPITQFGSHRSKLADMATSCYAGESATYRASKDIEEELLLVKLKASHQDAGIKR